MDRWSSGSAAETQAVTLTLMTLAPIFAACTIARANVETVPALRLASMSPPTGISGSKAREDCRIEITVVCGATPATPSDTSGGGGG
jgi:hypothetical protein